MHDLPRLARFHDDGRAGPQSFPNEVMMHGGGGDEARYLDPVRSDFPVRQDEQRRAPFPNGPACLAAKLVHGLLEGARRPPEHGR